jgi:hypothetical protein
VNVSAGRCALPAAAALAALKRRASMDEAVQRY